MKKIYKYQLLQVDDQYVKMHKNAEILSIDVQNGIPCIWAMIDDDAA